MNSRSGEVCSLTADLCLSGLREKAAEAYKITEEKTAGVGLKLDVVFSLLRFDNFHCNSKLEVLEEPTSVSKLTP